MLELISRRLREVTVRPAVGADERNRWDALMGAHHYLPFRGLVGRSVRHVAVLGEHWLALVGWHAGAFKLRARDRWIGWLPEQQFRRLHLIANNARFLILPECAAANLASRVLGLSLRWLSGDFRAMHGHPILIAETFVDPARFTGACYRAANWQALGHTRGFARKPGTPATWVPHGRPKEVLVYLLARDAREQLCRLDDAPKWRSEGNPRPWTAHRLRSLWECLHGVPDFRSTRGRRKRSCRALDLTEHRDRARLPHRQVAFRIERERRIVKTGKVEHETVHGLTSLTPDQATAEVVLALVRGHWSIENRLHHVRDVSYDEDRCRVRTGHLPRNLACLTNLAISIVRLKGRFDSLPQAHRHYARRPQDAVRQLINPPKR